MAFARWKLHFEKNQRTYDRITKSDYRLRPHEKKRIAGSLQQFQIGESSEGRHMIRQAELWGDPMYLEAARRFIREEQTHARLLLTFMKDQNIPPIRKHWVDSVFRWLRHFQGLETTISVLLTAEIMALPFYQALKRSTRSPHLQTICTKILEDEIFHIRFQAETLRHFYLSHSLFRKGFFQARFFVLTAGTALVVWYYHRAVLKTVFPNLGSFFGEVLDHTQTALHWIALGEAPSHTLIRIDAALTQ